MEKIGTTAEVEEHGYAENPHQNQEGSLPPNTQRENQMRYVGNPRQDHQSNNRIFADRASELV